MIAFVCEGEIIVNHLDLQQDVIDMDLVFIIHLLFYVLCSMHIARAIGMICRHGHVPIGNHNEPSYR